MIWFRKKRTFFRPHALQLQSPEPASSRSPETGQPPGSLVTHLDDPRSGNFETERATMAASPFNAPISNQAEFAQRGIASCEGNSVCPLNKQQSVIQRGTGAHDCHKKILLGSNELLDWVSFIPSTEFKRNKKDRKLFFIFFVTTQVAPLKHFFLKKSLHFPLNSL